jgi:hypothetical protein
MQILKTAGYDMPNTFVQKAAEGGEQSSGIRSITKKGLSDSFGGQIQIVQMGTSKEQNEDGGPGQMVPVEKWLIWNPQITSVGFGDLDYTSEDLINIDVGITYDFAELADNVGGQELFTTELSQVNNFTGGETE